MKSRHRLELEGYRNEAKGLKQRLKHLYQIIRNRERYSQRATRQSFPADLTTLWHRREADKEDEDEVDDLDYEQYDHLNRR